MCHARCHNCPIATFADRRTPNAERKHRLNREIMATEVRLNGVENEPLGIVSTLEALRMAGELDVDLVEIAATAEALKEAEGRQSVQWHELSDKNKELQSMLQVARSKGDEKMSAEVMEQMKQLELLHWKVNTTSMKVNTGTGGLKEDLYSL